MMAETDDKRLTEFGQAVRERRKAHRLPLRELAGRVGISPSYLSSIEVARNPATGRPPQISATVAERLCEALGLDWIPAARAEAAMRHGCCDHVLLYRLDRRRDELGVLARRIFGERVANWLCIEDPGVKAATTEGFHAWNWPFSSEPYPDVILDGSRIVTALEREAMQRRDAVGEAPYGLIIADCSAVMRWVVNPDAEIDYEEEWCAASDPALRRVFGRGPAVNVCVYHQMDIEVLAGRIDVLDALLRLLRHHDTVIAVRPDGSIREGTAAIMAILEENRPAGISTSVWRTFAAALAASREMPHRTTASRFGPCADHSAAPEN